VGSYIDAKYVYHGFVRVPSGLITTFDVPGAGTGGTQGTYAFSNNADGAIVGRYLDAAYMSHGFVRTAGVITSFDVPGLQRHAGL